MRPLGTRLSVVAQSGTSQIMSKFQYRSDY